MSSVISTLKSFEQHLDDTPFTKTQRKVWILSAMGVLLDGFDFFIIGVALPEAAIEQAMFAGVVGREKLPGKTILLIDVSGSMVAPLSRRSEMLRTDAAYGLAILLRETCENVSVYS